ncbi:HEAT repeat domain-containing protein [Patescibacteria group bacterium]|nr:HEAT repeat domain-containing protein [Patescibacteria group bacterium]
MIKEQKKIWKIFVNNDTTTENIKFLVDMLKHKSKAVRASSAHAIGSLKIRKGLGPLIDALSSNFGLTFYFAVVQFGPEVVGLLEQKLKQKTTISFRSNMAGVLGYFPNSKSFNLLCKLINDESAQVRRMAASKMVHMKDPRAIKVLKQLLANEKNKNVRRFAELSLGELTGKGGYKMVNVEEGLSKLS